MAEASYNIQVYLCYKQVAQCYTMSTFYELVVSQILCLKLP